MPIVAVPEVPRSHALSVNVKLPTPPSAGRDLRRPEREGRIVMTRIAYPDHFLSQFPEEVVVSGVLDGYKRELWAAVEGDIKD